MLQILDLTTLFWGFLFRHVLCKLIQVTAEVDTMMMITTVDMVAMVDTVAMEEEDTDGAFCSFSVLCDRTWFGLFPSSREFSFLRLPLLSNVSSFPHNACSVRFAVSLFLKQSYYDDDYYGGYGGYGGRSMYYGGGYGRGRSMYGGYGRGGYGGYYDDMYW